MDLATPYAVPLPAQVRGDLLDATGAASALPVSRAVDEAGTAIGAAATELVQALALLRYDTTPCRPRELTGRVIQHLEEAARGVADASAALAPGRGGEALVSTTRCMR
ncbi:hypothetical protein [Nocardioides sp.]|uniref:hypothetical protein n=1 Tax=Nocardioides sp. TaxID=35761 RepID=UPI003D0EAF59